MTVNSLPIALSGTITLSFDAGETVDYTDLYWTGLEYGYLTDIKVRLRTAPDDSGSPYEWSNWSEYYGEDETTSYFAISPLINRWIELEATLKTTDLLLTPYLDDISIGYETLPEMASGVITLNYNAGTPVNWTDISWTGTEDGFTTDIVCRIRTTEDDTGKPDETKWSDWSPYYGKDTTLYNYSVSIPRNQWLQIELYLMTKALTLTPELQDLTVTYTP